MSSSDSIQRLHVLFSGRVQGVGFRYSVCHEAEPFDVTGFVRNLWDGDVELVAEGRESELIGFLRAIGASRLERNIVGKRVSWEKATGEFKQFEVLFR